jgi:hypothetical protein
MSSIKLHSSLQRFSDGQSSYEIPGCKTIHGILKELTFHIPNLLKIIFDKNEKLNPFIVIYIDGQDTRQLGNDYVVPENANIEILTSLVGG